jgi:hypothetical protein
LSRCHSSNVHCRAYKDALWEISLLPRFPSCRLASHKPVKSDRDDDGKDGNNANCHLP